MGAWEIRGAGQVQKGVCRGLGSRWVWWGGNKGGRAKGASKASEGSLLPRVTGQRVQGGWGMKGGKGDGCGAVAGQADMHQPGRQASKL